MYNNLTIPITTEELVFFSKLPHSAGKMQGQPSDPLRVVSTWNSRTLYNRTPPKVVLISVYEEKLEVNGGGLNTLKSDWNFEFCPLGNIQLFERCESQVSKSFVGSPRHVSMGVVRGSSPQLGAHGNYLTT